MSTGTGSCSCWWQVSLHEGHCCFLGPPPEAFDPDLPALPCGHDDPRVEDR